MKKLLSILLLSAFIVNAQAQKIKTKEVDKFTKSEVIETSTERLYSKNLMGTGFCNIFQCSIRKVDGVYTMPAGILMNDIVKYDENSNVVFLLSNNETITLKTAYTGIGGERFANGYWFYTAFILSPSDVEKLKAYDVESIRVNYMGGCFDRDLKKNKKSIISKMLKLVDSEKSKK